MNGLATALDTAAGRCFQTIKRSVAAPSPEYWRTTSFYQKRICEKYLTVPEPEAAQPQDLAVIGHGDDLLMLYSRISRVTTFYPISHYCSTDAVALFNLRGHAVQLQRSGCSIWCGILICARLRYVSGKEWGSKRYLCMKYLTEAATEVA